MIASHRDSRELTGSADLVTVRDLVGPEEMAACDALYGDVMELRPEDGRLNPRLLLAIQHNGGYVVGAFLGDLLVGFAYSFPAWMRTPSGPGPLYQYSQLTVVAPALQNAGVGRRLKLAQRERALADGIGTMRWAFDPLKTRNAHFNLDVLGGRLIEFVPAMYGSHGFGRDHADESDRFLVEWPLDGEARTDVSWLPAATGLAVGEVRRGDRGLLVGVPADWERQRSAQPEAARSLRHQLRADFAGAFADGFVGVSCQRLTGEVAAYRFVPPGGSR